MPIYEYQCTNCEHKMEALQKFSDDPLSNCPSCEQDKLKKLISAASFRLKGSGWYETDFKTGNKKQLAESDSADSSKAGKDGGDNSDSGKTAADATSKTKATESAAGNNKGGNKDSNKSTNKDSAKAKQSSGNSAVKRS